MEPIWPSIAGKRSLPSIKLDSTHPRIQGYLENMEGILQGLLVFFFLHDTIGS